MHEGHESRAGSLWDGVITEHLKVLNGYHADLVCHIFPDDIPVWIHSTDTNHSQ